METLDKETAKYIIDYFSSLLTGKERMAIKHTSSVFKLGSANTSNLSTLTSVYREKGWLTEDQDVLDLLKDGYDSFEMSVATRILHDHGDKVFLNNCPVCGKLARTPQARQCRHCRHNWHHLAVAKFKLKGSFQLTARLQFYLIGEITAGEIKIGNYIDLTMVGLNCKPKIEAIEFALNRQDGKVWEDIVLGVNELSEEQKEYLKKIGSFGTPFDIVKEP